MSTPTTPAPAVVTPLPVYATLVFLVDDQVMVGEAIRRSLSNQADINFHFCASPVEALSRAVKIKPTVILQDLVMPGIDGLELVRQYRNHPATCQTPVLVLSTKEEAQVKSDAFAAGANDYLVKLPDRLELLARVRYHSKAYLNQIQRDETFRALQESQFQLVQSNSALLALNRDLETALAQVTQLQGLLPICSYCKKIRDGQDYWHQVENYLATRADVTFSHSFCPECYERVLKLDLEKLSTQSEPPAGNDERR
jgi:two-component system chemotaxis family response regulator WspR